MINYYFLSKRDSLVITPDGCMPEDEGLLAETLDLENDSIYLDYKKRLKI